MPTTKYGSESILARELVVLAGVGVCRGASQAGDDPHALESQPFAGDTPEVCDAYAESVQPPRTDLAPGLELKGVAAGVEGAEDNRLFRLARPIAGSGIMGLGSGGAITCFGTHSSSGVVAAVAAVDVFDVEVSVMLSAAEEVGSSAILVAALLGTELRVLEPDFFTPVLVPAGFVVGVLLGAGVRFEAEARLGAEMRLGRDRAVKSRP